MRTEQSQLEARYDGILKLENTDVVKREKGIAGAPSPDILAALTTCDFVLVGSAD